MLDAFDSKTMFFALLIVNISTTLSVAFLLTYRKDFPPIKWWLAMKVCILLGLALVLLRSHIPAQSAVIFMNFFVITAHAFLWIFSRKSANRQVNYKYLALIVFFFWGPILWFTFIEPDLYNRVMISSFACFAFSIAGAVELLITETTKISYGRKLTALFFSLNSFKWCYAVLIVPFKASEENFINVQALNVNNIVASSLILNILLTVGVLIIILEHVNQSKNTPPVSILPK